VSYCLEQIFKVSNKLGNLSVFASVEKGKSSKSIDDHLSHTVPALEALLSTYLIAAYAVARDYDFHAIQTFFPRVVNVAVGPRERNESYKKPLLFWPIEFGWGYPDEIRSNLVVQRYEKSERISSLFGGSEGIKSRVLQLDCYVEWNSFLCVIQPLPPQIDEYLREHCEYCKGTSFDYYPHFTYEHFKHVAPIIGTLWNLAGSGSLNYLSGFALDTNIAQHLVNMGPDKRKELFASFVLHAQHERAQYCLQNRRLSESFSWTENLDEAVKAARKRREAQHKE
jgi:hypothetical protein